MEVKLRIYTSYIEAFFKISLRLRGALLILYLGYVLTMFHRVAIAIMADRLIHDLNLNLAQMGVMAAVYFYPYALMQFPVGILVDRIGPNSTETDSLNEENFYVSVLKQKENIKVR